MTQSSRLDWMHAPIKKVAIIGGSGSRRQAPYADPSWEIWGFSNLRLKYPRITRWFELHAVEAAKRGFRKTRTRRSFREQWAYMQRLNCPVYLQRAHPDIPRSLTYPLDQVVEAFGRCFSSSASYLVALAILEGFEGIGLWGVDLTLRSHYIHQRAGLEYLLSVAKSRGIHVYLTPTSRLVIPKVPKPAITKALYGYEWRAKGAWWNRRPRVRRRKKKPMRHGKV